MFLISEEFIERQRGRLLLEISGDHSESCIIWDLYNKITQVVWYLFIDQNSSDKVISGLIVKIVSEELSNLKKEMMKKGCLFSK